MIVVGNKRREHADTEVKAVKDDVAADDDDVEDKPGCLKPHVQSPPLETRDRRRKISPKESGSEEVSSGSTGGGGPSLICRSRSRMNTTNTMM